MADKPTKAKQTESDANVALFRRAEDWERLTRLEFLVEELSRDNERRDLRIDKIMETQEELSAVQSKMLQYARDIRMILVGACVVISLIYFGDSKFFHMVLSSLIAGV